MDELPRAIRSGEERVPVARHALLFESRLNDSPENASNNVME
jgi:hypothetical protein